MAFKGFLGKERGTDESASCPCFVLVLDGRLKQMSVGTAVVAGVGGTCRVNTQREHVEREWNFQVMSWR